MQEEPPTARIASEQAQDFVRALPAAELKMSLAQPCIRWPQEEAWERKRLIKERGQPAQLDIDFLEGLRPGDESILALIVTPLDGWLHLVQDPAECIAAYGPYHVSICQASLASDEDVQKLRGRFAGMHLRLHVSDVTSEGCLELGECAITQDETFRRLHGHPYAWYRDRPVHISA